MEEEEAKALSAQELKRSRKKPVAELNGTNLPQILAAPRKPRFLPSL
jgi:hypothetical protein